MNLVCETRSQAHLSFEYEKDAEAKMMQLSRHHLQAIFVLGHLWSVFGATCIPETKFQTPVGPSLTKSRITQFETPCLQFSPF